MSRRHNTKHTGRSKSRYPQRLVARGLGKAPTLAEIEGPSGLRVRQERRIRETCSLTHAHDVVSCDGQPWRVFEAEAEAEVTTARTDSDLTVKIERLAAHY